MRVDAEASDTHICQGRMEETATCGWGAGKGQPCLEESELLSPRPHAARSKAETYNQIIVNKYTSHKKKEYVNKIRRRNNHHRFHWGTNLDQISLGSCSTVDDASRCCCFGPPHLTAPESCTTCSLAVLKYINILLIAHQSYIYIYIVKNLILGPIEV